MPISSFYLESRKMPFVRLLMAFIIGIVLQWYLNIPLVAISVVFIIALLAYLLFPLLSKYQAFQYGWWRGILLLLMVSAVGSSIGFLKNPLHQKNNIINVYANGDAVVATINETLINKANTYKANATVTAVYHHKKYIPATGIVIIYFDKKNLSQQLQYGSQILFVNPLQRVINTGNPGAIDYQRFLLFQGITSQLYLKADEYQILPQSQTSSFQIFIQQLRAYVIQTLQTYIPNKKAQGVAEALLIGYRNDLDKQLVQAYSNTGVVHIIAISGLHLGMIYGFVLLLFSSCKSKRWYRFAVPVVALSVLWLFTLLAGAVPSILRSAVTFSFMAAGIFINRKTNIYNTLAASAFCLLIFNPFLLWDVGFQLSYAAVLSILLFTKPIYNCLYLQNKWLNKIWQLSCVNLAAQILTLPIVLYNFHQFPLLFLINNLLVIPLSEMILFVTLLLVIVSKWSSLSIVIGKLSVFLLSVMNSFIEHTEKMSLTLLSNIKIDVVQAWLLYAIIILLAVWLLFTIPRLFIGSLSLAIIFIMYTSVDLWRVNHQEKLIVYNINKHIVIDVISGRNATCFCDSSLISDIQANSFYIKPGRTIFRIDKCSNKVLSDSCNFLLHANNKTILFLSKPVLELSLQHKVKADVIVISGNKKLYIDDVLKVVDCNYIIADNNTSFWKIAQWKKDCDSLHIPFYSVSQQGAFIADL